MEVADTDDVFLAAGRCDRSWAMFLLPAFKSHELTSQKLRLQSRGKFRKVDIPVERSCQFRHPRIYIRSATKREVRLRLSVGFRSPLAPSRRPPLLVAFSGERLTGSEVS